MKIKSMPSFGSLLFTPRALPLLTCLLALAGGAEASPSEGDKFEGAVWKFTMTPKTRGLKILKGQFRVSNNRLFQKTMPSSTDFDKLVGTNAPRGKKTTITFADLRAADKNKNWHHGIKGKVLLTMDRFGKWSGRLIDSQGRHWAFGCTRVQE